MPLRRHPSRVRRSRRGSALLVCTLAITVVSLASVAILKSNQRAIARVDASRSSRSGRCVADGLVQRTIAVLRENPTASGTITDPALASARCDLQVISPSATRITIYLYNTAVFPAIDVTLDPTAL